MGRKSMHPAVKHYTEPPPKEAPREHRMQAPLTTQPAPFTSLRYRGS